MKALWAEPFPEAPKNFLWNHLHQCFCSYTVFPLMMHIRPPRFDYDSRRCCPRRTESIRHCLDLGNTQASCLPLRITAVFAKVVISAPKAEDVVFLSVPWEHIKNILAVSGLHEGQLTIRRRRCSYEGALVTACHTHGASHEEMGGCPIFFHLLFTKNVVSAALRLSEGGLVLESSGRSRDRTSIAHITLEDSRKVRLALTGLGPFPPPLQFIFHCFPKLRQQRSNHDLRQVSKQELGPKS